MEGSVARETEHRPILDGFRLARETVQVPLFEMRTVSQRNFTPARQEAEESRGRVFREHGSDNYYSHDTNETRYLIGTTAIMENISSK